MSFCSRVKQELSKLPPARTCCAVAESYGVLLFCNTFSPNAIRIVTESRDFAQRLPKLFSEMPAGGAARVRARAAARGGCAWCAEAAA